MDASISRAALLITVELIKRHMNAEQILAHLRKQPFEPFRVFMSDWSSYEVRYPELAIALRWEVVIALAQVPDKPAERLV